MKKSVKRVIGVALGGITAMGAVQAAEQGGAGGDWSTNTASNVTVGFAMRTKSPSCTLTGDPNANSCGASANTAQWANGDDGNLNYKKNQFYTGYASLTSELLATNPSSGLKFMARGTALYDFLADNTRRTPLSQAAKNQAVQPVRLLDFWGEKDFSIGNQPAFIRVGNQVINWGESYFASGGINATNSLDWQMLLTPGTQLKQALIPAPMINFNTSINERSTFQAYYQLDWNGNRYPAVGTFWSASDAFGKGAVPASFNGANFNVAGQDAASLAGAAAKSRAGYKQANEDLVNGVYFPAGLGFQSYTVNPKNNNQLGARVTYKPESINASLGFYYERYTDKAPVVSYMPDGSLRWSYLKDRELFGASANFPIGDWAVGTELSYRPRDAVATTGCYNVGGPSDSNTNGAFGIQCDAWKDMKKYQFILNGQLYMSQSSHPWLKTINADLGAFTAELAVIRYPGLYANRQFVSNVNGTQVYQLPAAAYGTWLTNDSTLGTIATGQGTATSAGLTVDFNVTYDSTLIPGWQVIPGVTLFGTLTGHTPTFSANYERGAKSAYFYMLFNQNPAVWQAGISHTRLWGGNAITQPYSDRNNVSFFVTRNF